MNTNTSTTWFESLFILSLIHLHSKSFCASFKAYTHEYAPGSFCACQYTQWSTFKLAQFALRAWSQIFNQLNIVEHFEGWKFYSWGWSIPMKSLVHTEELCSQSVPLEYALGAKSLVRIDLYNKVGMRAKRRNEGGRGGGERRKHLPPSPTILKLYLPTNVALVGPVLVVLINEWPILKPNQVWLFMCVVDEKCFGLFMRRFIRPDLQASLASSLFQPFRLKWNIGDRVVETSDDYFIGNDNMQIWLKNWTVCWRYIFTQNYQKNKWINTTTYCKANKGSLPESCLHVATSHL